MSDGLVWLLALSFSLAAWLYSSVGHGGGSAYLAILALTGLPRATFAPLALTLNLVVSGLGWANYARAGHFSRKLLWPFVTTSIPAAFLGGLTPLPKWAFSLVLGLVLLLAALRLLLLQKPVTTQRIPEEGLPLWRWGLPLGALLGYLAGLIGIGGGIFLSPLLLFLGWADAKRVGAVSAAFIFLNSASGLIAHMLAQRTPNLELLLPLTGAVLLGGALGSHLGATRFSATILQRLLGVVLLVAALKMLRDATGL
ncbi:MAG: sulfite exporter TauE/SafE family protein [Candidatus Bipolaricaulota bacterium]|nr:sulfite exporter TauE/SafE family protein [Candidatus Bipolaricaulota bacterium]MDW8328988.1 sulfite exporter TauE/SafE family protein [Candidatus Bipolaricaulota bacterium]